ncbi:conjugal transfer protein TraF [Helicobacter bizzozeronii]|uniref:conjugal transfer protein TraF n=1 Tax=Helicobacter bizzozeronii TaxID=56877 RepID=UPI000CEEA5BD|nr:conjugal transfer protein TraF [Helicobacter bizzozeronii]
MAVVSAKRVLFYCALACGGLEGLEFGQMGDTSFGMGGAGVALENSSWGLYYNPALLDIDSRTKFGYSFGASIGQESFLELVSKALSGSALGKNTEALNQLFQSHAEGMTKFITGQSSSITINANEGKAAQTLVEMANLINNSIKSNGVHLASQNGFVLQIHPKVKRKGGIGTFGIGIFASAFVGGSLLVNPKYNQIIIPTSIIGLPPMPPGAHVPPFIQIGASKNSLTLSQSNQRDFYNSSLLSPNAKNAAALRGLAIGSVPFGYAYGFDFHKGGKLSVGVALRYLYTLSYGMGLAGNLQSLIPQIKGLLSNFSFNFSDVVQQSHFGLDLGTAYRIKGFTIGLVGKYLNAPKIRYNSAISDMRIDPQVRLGLGYRWKWLNLAVDFDLTNNKTLMIGRRSQMIGGGIMANWKWFGIKFGAMGNVSKEGLHEGVILTGGLRFFRVLDISVQSSLKMIAFNNLDSLGGSGGFLGGLSNLKIPTYLAFRIGGGWEW